MDDASFATGHKIATRIAAKWGLTPAQTEHLLANDIERISHVLVIYKALMILFPTEQQAVAWPRKPNRSFQGRSALDLMLEGDLCRVRSHLEGQCPDASAQNSDWDSGT